MEKREKPRQLYLQHGGKCGQDVIPESGAGKQSRQDTVSRLMKTEEAVSRGCRLLQQN